MEKSKLYSSWKELVTYQIDGPTHFELIKTENYNGVLVGLEAGQRIPPHAAPEALYHFLEGSGAMIVDGARMEVEPGATIAVLSGIARGIEAKTRLTLLASHAVPSVAHTISMPFKKMAVMGLAGIVVMAGLMIVLGRMVGGSNPMAALMFSTDGPIGFGLWGIMIIPFAAMILMMGGMFLLFRRMVRRNKPNRSMMTHSLSHHSQTTKSSEGTITLKVPDVSCDHCKMIIEDEIRKVAGVSSVAVDVKAKTAKISFAPPAALTDIEDKLSEIGYPADTQ